MKKTTKKKEEQQFETIESLSGVENSVRDDLLVELSNTIYWPAIIAYFNERKIFIDNGLRSTDSFQQPTMVARYQGNYESLDDLFNVVDLIKKNRRESEKVTDKK